MSRFLDDGNWVPMHKVGVADLPRHRAYSKVEAMFSLSVDIDKGHKRSVRAYSRIWRWDRKTVDRFLDSAFSETPKTGATRGATRSHGKFKYVSNLRRPKGHEEGQRGTTTKDPNPKYPGNRTSKNRKPWYGIGNNLDQLVACDAYISHLAQQYPVLAKWTFPEIQQWVREMVRKANEKRAQTGKKPVTSPTHLILACASRVRPNERPMVTTSPSAPRYVMDAIQAMGAQ